MHKFNTLLEFHFQKNIFKKVDWNILRKLENSDVNINTLNFNARKKP